MDKLINYIKSKESKNIKLILEVHYSKDLGWLIYIYKKGYDAPIIRVRENDIDEAFDLAYVSLVYKLEGHI